MSAVPHLVALLVALPMIAAGGRALARLLRLPPVVGEILLSLLAGPAVLAMIGPARFDDLVPQDLLGVFGQLGLVLFLVGVLYDLRRSPAVPRGGAVGKVTVAAFLLPLACGALFAVLVLGEPSLRGNAPLPAFLLLVSVCFAVTAVPVLARIIAEHRTDLGSSGRLALLSGVVMDAPAWLLLAVGIGFADGGLMGALLALVTLVLGMAIARLLQRPLEFLPVGRYPWTAALVVGAAAFGASLVSHEVGLTAIFGAILVGFAIPVRSAGKDTPWEPIVEMVGRVGRVLVPVYFVVAGVGLFTDDAVGGLSWEAAVIATVLAIVGKVGGGYLGARWAGEEREAALKVGVLVNTRGLTEIVLLQAGYSAGVLTPGLFLALLVMALVTTAMTGPLLNLFDRRRTEPVSGDNFRQLMAGFPTGVAVVTTSDAAMTPRGMTVSSVCSVALDPPTLLICLRNGSPTLEALLQRGTFAVNLLHDGGRETAQLFGSGAPDRFERTAWREDPDCGGPHLHEDAHATADCRVGATYAVGDHTVVFGEVFRVTDGAQQTPLLHGMRRYAAWSALEDACRDR